MLTTSIISVSYHKGLKRCLLKIISKISRNIKIGSARIPLKLLKNFIIPYFNKISEKFKSIAQKFYFNIVHKPMNCLNILIKTGKDKIKKEDHSNVVYKINCLDCNYSCKIDKKETEDAFKKI